MKNPLDKPSVYMPVSVTACVSSYAHKQCVLEIVTQLKPITRVQIEHTPLPTNQRQGCDNVTARALQLDVMLYGACLLLNVSWLSLACPQDSRAALPRFARPGRDYIHRVYI